MFDKFKQLMDLKKKAEQMKRELEATDIDVEEISGIKIVISGIQEFKSIEISEDHLGQGKKEKFESDLLSSLNASIQRVQAVAAEKMKAVSGL